jgi:hypothetical protein
MLEHIQLNSLDPLEKKQEVQNLYQLVSFTFQFVTKIPAMFYFLLAQFQNIQKKKVDQVQRKALVQELEEKQLKRMRPSKTVAPQGTNSSYGTSDEDVFYETVSKIIFSMPFSSRVRYEFLE